MMDFNSRLSDSKNTMRTMAVVLGLLVVASFASAAEEDEGWTGELAVGINAQSGSTDTFSGSINATTERKWEKHVLTGRLNGVYGTSRSRNESTNTETIQNAQLLSGGWKRILGDRFFWASSAGLSRDNTQDRELRAVLATGPGYRIWQGETEEVPYFEIAVGPGYRYEIYDGNTGASVDENGDTNHFADAVVAFKYFNHLFDGKIEYTQRLSGRVPMNDTSGYIVDTEITIGVPLSEAWSFRTVFFAEYIGEPGADEINNTTTRTTLGLGYKF